MKRSLAVVAFLIVGVAPAWAHGDLRSSDPEAGSRVQEPPTEVSLELAEPPTAESQFSVVDGCGDDVVADVSRAERRVRLALSNAQPGRWSVEYRTVSALDGHLVRGDFAFRVAGERDCSEASPDPEGTDSGDDIAGPGLQTGEDAGTGPLIPMLALGGGIVILALVIRRFMTH